MWTRTENGRRWNWKFKLNIPHSASGAFIRQNKNGAEGNFDENGLQSADYSHKYLNCQYVSKENVSHELLDFCRFSQYTTNNFTVWFKLKISAKDKLML